MRVPRRARFAAEAEVDSDLGADGFEPVEHGGGFGGAKFLDVKVAFVDAGGGSIGVEVEGVPGRGEGIFGIGVGSLVEGDGEVEFLSAYVALG